MSLIGRTILIQGRFKDEPDQPIRDIEPYTISGRVLARTDDERFTDKMFIVIEEADGGQQEYVWEAGYHGAHGWIDGLGTALREGRATLKMGR